MNQAKKEAGTALPQSRSNEHSNLIGHVLRTADRTYGI